MPRRRRVASQASATKAVCARRARASRRAARRPLPQPVATGWAGRARSRAPRTPPARHESGKVRRLASPCSLLRASCGRPCPVSGLLRLLLAFRLSPFRFLPASSLGRARPRERASRSAASRRLRSLRLPVRGSPSAPFGLRCASAPARGRIARRFGGLSLARCAPAHLFFCKCLAFLARFARAVSSRQARRNAAVAARFIRKSYPNKIPSAALSPIELFSPQN